MDIPRFIWRNLEINKIYHFKAIFLKYSVGPINGNQYVCKIEVLGIIFFCYQKVNVFESCKNVEPVFYVTLIFRRKVEIVYSYLN